MRSIMGIDRKLNIKIIEALKRIGIVLSSSLDDCERRLPYEKYISRSLLSYTGCLPPVHNVLEGDERPKPNLPLINKIYSAFYCSGDEDLKKVAYNTFFDVGFNGDIPSFPLPNPDPEWLKVERDEQGFCFNRSKPFVMERLKILPMNEGRFLELKKHLKDADKENEGYEECFVGYGEHVSFVIENGGEMLGAISLFLTRIFEEGIYELVVYIKKEYRNKGYGKEAINGLLKALDNQEVVVYGYRDYFLRCEEYSLCPSLVRAVTNASNMLPIKMMEGSILSKEGIRIMKLDSESSYQEAASYYYLVDGRH